MKYIKKKTPRTITRKNNFTRESSVQFATDSVHFSKKTTKEKTKWKRTTWVKLWLKNRMYTSAFNNIFQELMVNDKGELRRIKESIPLRISFLPNRIIGISYIIQGYFLFPYSNLFNDFIVCLFSTATATVFVWYSTFSGTAQRSGSFHYWRNATNC